MSFLYFKTASSLFSPSSNNLASYSLYLLHTLIGTTIINLSMRFLGEVAITNNWLIFFIALFVSIAVAFFYWKFIEKPSQKFSKNLKIEK